MSFHWIPTRRKALTKRMPVLHPDIQTILQSKPALPSMPTVDPIFDPFLAHYAPLSPNEACHVIGASVMAQARIRNTKGSRYRLIELAGAVGAYELAQRGEVLTVPAIICQAKIKMAEYVAEIEAGEAAERGH